MSNTVASDRKAIGSWFQSHPAETYGLDVETTGLDPWADGWQLRLVQFSDGVDSICIPAVDNKDTLVWVFDVLTKINAKLATHTNFDPLCLRAALGVDLKGRVTDTHIESVLANPARGAEHGLKALARQIGIPELADAETELDAEFKTIAPKGVSGKNKLKEWGFANIPTDNPVYLKYAGLDAVAVQQLSRRVTPSKLSELEHWLSEECMDLRFRGLKLDVTRTKSLLNEVAEPIEAARSRIEQFCGFPAGSPKRAQWLADKGAELSDSWLTDKGEYSLCAEQLEYLAMRHEKDWLAWVIGDMRAISLNSNLMSNLRQFLDHESDGRVHPEFKTMRARTGRMSIVSPAMQTMKKKDPRLRGCFIADEGMSLVACDFSQVELRVAAALSEDKRLTELILNGVDLHDATAELLFGPDFTEDQRRIAKVGNFLPVYGGGAKALSDKTGLPLDKAKEITNQWRTAHSGLTSYGKYLGHQARLENPFGRKLIIDPERPYSALNYMIQSTARDLFVVAVKRVCDNLHQSKNLWLLIHDEVVMQVPEDEADSWAELIKDEMETTFRGIPITAEASKLGTRWSGE